MTIKRSVSMFALPLALALVSPIAHAKDAKEQAAPAARPAQIKVDSPTMATSISDWHAELGNSKAKTSPTAGGIGCTCGKTTTQATTTKHTPIENQATTTTASKTQTAQRPPQISASGRPAQRAQEVPLTSVKR
jgi:hypothetical protein